MTIEGMKLIELYEVIEKIDLPNCNIRQLLALRDMFSDCLDQVDNEIKSRD